MSRISVVVPVYKCSDCLRPLTDRLLKVLKPLTNDFEVIYVEDGGNDGSWEMIQDIAAEEKEVKGFQLSRNFGQHAAITAGLHQAVGDWAVVMDCDLQDPPEEIPRLFEKAEEGYDVVFARRRLKVQPFVKRQFSHLYFKVLSVLTRTKIEGSYGSFSIISRKVIDAFLCFKDTNRHYLFILHWVGFRSTSVEYEQNERWSGRSSYYFGKLISHAMSGMFFQTTRLLNWIIYLGFATAVSGILAAIYFAYRRLFGSALPGWTSLIVVVLATSGLIVMTIGITGLYIGQVFEQVKARPLFVISRRTDQ